MSLSNLTTLPGILTVPSRHHFPQCPGVYLIFDIFGDVIYVGQTGDLRRRIGEHESGEDNFLLSLLMRYTICFPLDTPEEAERLEGWAFDRFVLIHGRPPSCNGKLPPASIYTRNPLLRALRGITLN